LGFYEVVENGTTDIACCTGKKDSFDRKARHDDSEDSNEVTVAQEK
jgi:hypothetical protein